MTAPTIISPNVSPTHRGTASRGCIIGPPPNRIQAQLPGARNSERAKAAREGLFVQFVTLAQLGGYRVGHDLAAMNLGGLAPVNRGVPTRIRAAVNGHPEIAGADSLLHDLFKLGGCLLLLIHATRSLDDDGVSAVSSFPFQDHMRLAGGSLPTRARVWVRASRSTLSAGSFRGQSSTSNTSRGLVLLVSEIRNKRFDLPASKSHRSRPRPAVSFYERHQLEYELWRWGNLSPTEIARAAELREALASDEARMALNDDLQEYHELAKRNGTTLPAALGRYIAMENLLKEDLIAGMEMIAKNAGFDLTALMQRVLLAEPEA
jgi:hypothetical protein